MRMPEITKGTQGNRSCYNIDQMMWELWWTTAWMFLTSVVLGFRSILARSLGWFVDANPR